MTCIVRIKGAYEHKAAGVQSTFKIPSSFTSQQEITPCPKQNLHVRLAHKHTHTPLLLWIQAAFGGRRTGPREELSESQLPPSSNRKSEPYLRGVNAKIHRTMKLFVH